MLNIAMLVRAGQGRGAGAASRRRDPQRVTKKEIGEILLHSAIYCGYPAALGGFRTAREYFAKARQEDPPRKKKEVTGNPNLRHARGSGHPAAG